MQNIIIDEEFKSLLPALSKDIFEALEENLIQNGCRDSLVLWNETLIDGHNRYEICTRLDIPFTTVSKEFNSREEVVIWIITTQIARRNLNAKQLSYYRGLHYRTDKKIAPNEKGTNRYTSQKGVIDQNDEQLKSTATSSRLAKQYNVSTPTIFRDANASEATDAIGEVSPEAKRMILAEEVRIEKKDLEALAKATPEVIAEVAKQIEEGTYDKKQLEALRPTEPTPAVDKILSGMQPLNKAIERISDDLGAELRNVTAATDRTALKVELRAYIDRLEELYTRL